MMDEEIMCVYVVAKITFLLRPVHSVRMIIILTLAQNLFVLAGTTTRIIRSSIHSSQIFIKSLYTHNI
jgi:hypothetical protein